MVRFRASVYFRYDSYYVYKETITTDHYLEGDTMKREPKNFEAEDEENDDVVSDDYDDNTFRNMLDDTKLTAIAAYLLNEIQAEIRKRESNSRIRLAIETLEKHLEKETDFKDILDRELVDRLV